MPAPRRPRQRYAAYQQRQRAAQRNAINQARMRALRPANQAPPVPAAPGGPPQASPPGMPQAPQAQFTPDAEYLAAAAQRSFDRQQALQALTSQGETDKTDTKEAIRRLLADAPEQRNQIKVGANKAGLFYSGQLGKQLNEYEADLTQRQGDINLDFQRRESARAAARRAIEQGMPLEEAAALAEAATRQVERDTAAADARSLVPPPAAPARTVPPGRRRPPARRRPNRRRRRR